MFLIREQIKVFLFLKGHFFHFGEQYWAKMFHKRQNSALGERSKAILFPDDESFPSYMAPQLASAIANCSKHTAQLSQRAAPHALCL